MLPSWYGLFDAGDPGRSATTRADPRRVASAEEGPRPRGGGDGDGDDSHESDEAEDSSPPQRRWNSTAPDRQSPTDVVGVRPRLDTRDDNRPEAA